MDLLYHVRLRRTGLHLLLGAFITWCSKGYGGRLGMRAFYFTFYFLGVRDLLVKCTIFNLIELRS